MSTLAVELHSLAQDVKYTENELIVYLIDGRTISVPLIWFPRLAHATKVQLDNWEVLGNGEGIHWPDIDEDISAEGMLYGIPAPRPRKSSK